MVKKVGVLLLIVIISITVAYFVVQHKVENYLNTPRIEKTVIFTVNSGSNFARLGRGFVKQSIIKDVYWWKLVGKLHPELTKIKSGTYEFQEGSNLNHILLLLNKGIEHQFKVTFVEGSTFKEWLKILENAPYLAALNKDESEILAQLGSSKTKLEGLLLPETYHYRANMPVLDIIAKAYDHQQRVIERLWAERDKDLPLKTPYEALILASIIEKESGLSADRDKISSVFINRLRIGMRLQTDPTVIYGMGDKYQGRIRSRDLREATAYNTYRINGLPPTPICMPSEAALYAALHPATTKYLYFVSKGDGSSYFSKNLVEHNRAVNKYILGK